MTKWHSGPPPSLGWWPCEIRGWPYRGYLRWWNGRCWSWAARPNESAEDAARWANKLDSYRATDIIWSARPESWPERSKT